MSSSTVEDAWKPVQYEMFLDVRHRPGIDLMERAKVHWRSKHHSKQPQRIYDLGCGTGRLAAELSSRFPASSVIGVDSSAAMLLNAHKLIDSQQQASVTGRVSFVQHDVATFEPLDGETDMIYSNAALHWIDSDRHNELFARLMGQLRFGGLLAVQMPNNFSQPSHTLIHQTLADLGFSDNDKMKAVLRAQPRLPSDPLTFYHNAVAKHASVVDIWETTYLQPLSSSVLHPVAEFTRGSYLGPILSSLSPADQTRLLSHYSSLLKSAYSFSADNSVCLFPFHRVFIIAMKK